MLVSAELFKLAPPSITTQDRRRSPSEFVNVAPQVSKILMRVLSGYLSDALPHPPEASRGPEDALVPQIQAEAAANAAILLCLAVGREEELWSAVYPKFEACKSSAAFLQLLIPPILRNQLTSLDPAVMQASLDVVHPPFLSLVKSAHIWQSHCWISENTLLCARQEVLLHPDPYNRAHQHTLTDLTLKCYAKAKFRQSAGLLHDVEPSRESC